MQTSAFCDACLTWLICSFAAKAMLGGVQKARSRVSKSPSPRIWTRRQQRSTRWRRKSSQPSPTCANIVPPSSPQPSPARSTSENPAMPDTHTEVVFENELFDRLAAHGWLYSPSDTGYDRDRALFPEDLFAWLKATQPVEWAKHEASSKGHAEGSLLDRLLKLMEEHGSLWVLRNTVKAVAAKFDLCQFKPSHGLNPETLAKYESNRLRVMRQVHYSTSNQNSIDLVFFVNGIPVATAELKTDFKKSVEDAKNQYRS